MILQRSGDDLRRARGVSVDEHYDRHARPPFRLAIVVRPRRVGRAAVHAHDALPGVEKQIGDADTLIEQAARIRTQVEHQRSHARGAQGINRAAKVDDRLLTEDRQRDVADAVAHDLRVLHGADVNFAAGQRELEGRRDSAAPHRDAHHGAGRAAQRLLRLLDGDAPQRLAVDIEDAITGLNPRVHRGAAGQGRDDDDPAVAHVDLRADSRVASRRALGQAAPATAATNSRCADR